MATKINPLKSHITTKWLKTRGSVNFDYSRSLSEKKQLSELKTLFERFDGDGSGTLDMDEVTILFELAGLKMSRKDVK
jgi:Ca2+-binding EF-hand superfamily protein